MKRTARMEYQLNDTRAHVISRCHLARNPVEVAVDVEAEPGAWVRVTLEVFVDGTFEVAVGGDIKYVGAVS